MGFKIGDKVKRKENMWKGLSQSVIKENDILTVINLRFQETDYPSLEFKEVVGCWDREFFELAEEMKISKFKIGDRVISVKNTPSVPEGFIGKIVAIKELEYPIEVRSDSGLVHPFNENELELLSVSGLNVPSDAKQEHLDWFRKTVEKVSQQEAEYTGGSSSALDKQVSGNHYKDCGIQPIEYIHANGLNYFEGNAVKYITRHRKKNGKADIEKAMHYLELMLELEYKES